jgi:hypothetical protein
LIQTDYEWGYLYEFMILIFYEWKENLNKNTIKLNNYGS